MLGYVIVFGIVVSFVVVNFLLIRGLMKKLELG